MKKILFAFMAMYCFIACDPSDSFPDNEGEWWVKNDTNEAIGIWCDWTFMEPKIEKVMPGDSLWLYSYDCFINREPVFDDLFIIGKTNRDEIQNQMRLKFARKLQKRNVTEKSHTSYSQKWLSNVN